jgi:hypothetical protein
MSTVGKVVRRKVNRTSHYSQRCKYFRLTLRTVNARIYNFYRRNSTTRIIMNLSKLGLYQDSTYIAYKEGFEYGVTLSNL